MPEIIEVFKHFCLRCQGSWKSELIKPKYCPKCHSPYWFKERLKTGEIGAVSKYGFDRMEIGKTYKFPFYCFESGEIDSKRNDKRSKALERFMQRNGYKYECYGQGGYLYAKRLT